jgi:hypothetical protein
MRNILIFLISFILSTIFMTSPSNAGYLDECLTRILPVSDGTYICAVQCNSFDFFIYVDKEGKPFKRLYVPKVWLEKLRLIDFKTDGRIFFAYQPDPYQMKFRGLVCNYSFDALKEAGLETMLKITLANDAWWGIASTSDEKPVLREISLDGFHQVDHKLPERNGIDYFNDMVSFTVDPKGDQILLFCHTFKTGFSGDGIIRKIHDGKIVAEWIVDVPHVPETDVQILWVGPITDKDGNIIVGHYEMPCTAKNDDRVRIHKYGPRGSEQWVWGEKLYIITDIQIAPDGTIVVLRPGGPIYSLTPDGKYKGEIIIDGISVLGEPECSQQNQQNQK